MGNDEFHLRFLMSRTLSSAGYYVAFLSLGFLYFVVAEGIWGAGLGKRLKGLRVVRANGRAPGIGRGLLRILIPILSIEGVRIPLLLATISSTRIDDMSTFEVVVYSVATAVCPWIPVLLSLTARRENGFATLWDLASGTRVVVKPKGIVRSPVKHRAHWEDSAGDGDSFGPYRITGELVPGQWLAAMDPVLRRQVWLLRRRTPEVPLPRRNLARPGRPRWLQKVEVAGIAWDAYEAIQGVPFSSLVEGGKRVPWTTLRQWLHDMASELWAATGDRSLPAELSLDQVWVTAQGQAVLLDEPWPDATTPAERIPVGDIAGQQRFLAAVAACVESTGLPLHARPVLQNLEDGKFEKLSFLAGTLRGLLDKPAEVSKGIRAGAIFMMPVYTWIMIFVGAYQGAEWLHPMIGDSVAWLAMAITLFVLLGTALAQVAALPFRTTTGHSVFRLAVVDDEGKLAARSRLLARWAIIWLPLLLPLGLVALLPGRFEGIAFIAALVLILLWIGAGAVAVLHPHRGWHDRMAGTWVVRR
jgi:uncharacterized RDD family membrane protein YckC